MADRKITAHTEILADAVAEDDVIEIVDISDTTDAASGTNKKLSKKEIKATLSFNERMIGTSQNRRHGPSGNANLGTLALSINALRACPIYIPQRVTIDKLGVEITAGTSGNIWVALYSCAANGAPDALVAWSGELTVTAPGVYEGLSGGGSVVVEPGTYWIAYLTNTANTARAMGSIVNLYSIFLGMPSTIGTTFGTGWAQTLTYTATAPATFTAGGAISNAGFNLPFMFYRAI